MKKFRQFSLPVIANQCAHWCGDLLEYLKSPKIICLLASVVLLAGCSQKETKTQESIFAMDTIMDVQIWGKDADAGAQQVEQMLYVLESRWSATSDSSLTAAINRGEDAAMTAEEQALLAEVNALSQRTGGAFCPNLGALSRAWGFYDKNYRVPTAREIQLAMEKAELDMGAALKGYAGDRAVEILQGLDVDRAILNLGGNIQTYGSKPDGQPWQIAIADPFGGGSLGILSIEGTMSIITSGSYQRFFEFDGKRYHHIMDGATGCPADNGLVSVTVICSSGLTADALSTALFVMGLENASDFWRESRDFEAVFVLEDGSIYATEGARLTGCEFGVIAR